MEVAPTAEDSAEGSTGGHSRDLVSRHRRDGSEFPAEISLSSVMLDGAMLTLLAKDGPVLKHVPAGA